MMIFFIVKDTTVGSTVLKVNVSDPDVPKTPLIYDLKSSTASVLNIYTIYIYIKKIYIKKSRQTYVIKIYRL